MNTFGERLKYALHLRDVSQAELARVIGVKQQAIYLLCAGKSGGTKHAFSIARYLRIDPEWLILGNGKPPGIDSADGQDEDDPFGHGLLTLQERELLALFRCLTAAQREESIKQLQEKERVNREVVLELSKTLGKGSSTH
jgi:transcriptional regulator with XRE-family HTH domain